MYRIIIVSIILSFGSVFAGAVKQLTIEDIFNSGKFRLKRLNNVQWMPDSKAFLFLKTDKKTHTVSIFKHTVKSGKETVYINGKDLLKPGSEKPLHFMSYSLSNSGNKIIFKSDARRVWRRYDEARFYVYDPAKKQLTPVYDGPDRIRHMHLSGDETRAGFTLHNNLFLKDFSTGQTSAITKDGSDVILNGLADWVYEEEFGQSDYWSWSPNSRYIAYLRFDQTRVPLFHWTVFDSLHVRVRSVHYPQPGDPNSIVRLAVYSLKNQKTTWIDLGANTDIYIPRFYFTPDSKFLLVERLNRLQNKLEILKADLHSGKVQVLFTETDSCWVDVGNDFLFLKKGPFFLKTSEEDGFKHIYLYNWQTGIKRQITKGHWEVAGIYGIDEQRGWIYFSANKGSIAERQIFKISLQGNNLKPITHEAGSHDANFSPDFRYFIESFSGLTSPPRYALLTAEGKRMRTLVENKIDVFREYGITTPQLLSFKTEDGVEIKAMMTKPYPFDPAKKYPVLIYGYSGPASQLVRNVWGRSAMWYTLLTQKGYIIFTLDQRGTGGRGKAFKDLAYGDIGKYALKDHIEGVKYLRSLPYVDKNRIGIWGWSGGGYLTLLAMTKGADYFKTGIAVAPVVDFRLYDDIWTERYMGLPQTNRAGYDSTSVLSYVDRFKGHLLIVHGTSDDNVHMQNTMQFVGYLQQMGKPFQMMIYPGRNHSLIGKGNVYLHLYKVMTQFILQNL